MKGMAQTKNKCSAAKEAATTNAAHFQVQKCARETVISVVFLTKQLNPLRGHNLDGLLLEPANFLLSTSRLTSFTLQENRKCRQLS